jgi:hypothetical protein
VTTVNSGAVAFVITCLFSSGVSGQDAAEQSVERVYLTNAETPRDLREIVAAIRTITQIGPASANPETRALTLRGTAAQLTLAEWLMGELGVVAGQPALVQQSQGPASHEFRVLNGGDDLVRVFHLKHATADRDLQEIATLFRVTADIQCLSAPSALRVVAARGTAAQIRAAEWLVDELDKPADWQPPDTSPQYPIPGTPNEVAKVFYPRSSATPRDLQELQELAAGVRVMTATRQVFTFESLGALVLRGTAEQIALAEWLITELDAPASRLSVVQQGQSSTPHEYWAPDPHGRNVVRVFQLTHAATGRDLQEIASQIRAKAGILNLFVCIAPRAVAARGTAVEIGLAEQLIKEWDQPHSLKDAH